MGVQGVGNFDNDDALYYLDELINQLVETIESGMSSDFILGDAEGLIMSSVDIVITLCETYREPLSVEASTILQWKETYLQEYDEHIDSYAPTETYKAKRRQVIEETFNKLEKIARRYDP